MIDASDARDLRQVGYYYVDRHRRGDEPELAVVGRRLARRPDLPLRHEPRRSRSCVSRAARPRRRGCRRCSEPPARADPLAARPVSGLDAGLARLPALRGGGSGAVAGK